MILPPYLIKGDTIGITCPAGYMNRGKIQTCINTFQEWGYEVMVGKTVGSPSKNYFSAPDKQRRDELQAMMDDDSIHAIFCGRGGYGVGRIIDLLDFTRFRKKPKWIIGFSDITVLHSHICTCLGIATMHAPMAAAFNDGGNKNKYIKSLKDAIEGRNADYSSPFHRLNRMGNTQAELVGGNLCLLTHLIGTSSEIKTKGRILFIEDIGEYIYQIDRMMYQLNRNGKLDQLAGLIIGEFSDPKDTDRPFGKKIYDVIDEVVREYKYPVCFGFPVGHGKKNLALKVGASYQLKIGPDRTTLKEN